MIRNIVCSLLVFFVTVHQVCAQLRVEGYITCDSIPLPFAVLSVPGTTIGSTSNEHGFYQLNVPVTSKEIEVRLTGYQPEKKILPDQKATKLTIHFNLKKTEFGLKEVIISGTMKEVTRLQSVVPVEVYSQAFLKTNPVPALFDAVQNMNGCRPQLNCNICNTGDIHINGLEGPYTMILIDGMPIVSSLASVYGLSGIPTSMVERIEIVKGPASALYGSEALGGLINVITKKGEHAPLLTADGMISSWSEINADLSLKLNVLKFADVLTGLNYFTYQNPIDQNGDGFTDVTLQNRSSVFQKWNIHRKDQKECSIAGRFLYENRWGGDLRWNEQFRGGDSIYGESIHTMRYELLAKYALPVSEDIVASFSYADHDQNSAYGTTYFLARQKTGFAQLVWKKHTAHHEILGGIASRFQVYADNTPLIMDGSKLVNGMHQQITVLPGLFVQDEFNISEGHTLLSGIRYDYHSNHGNIYTPRIGYKMQLNELSSIRVNSGTGFRVVNLFTEDHAALSGSRTVVVEEKLNPERSYNINLNYIRQTYFGKGHALLIDLSAFYTHFTNRIVPDYLTQADKIIYHNLNGFATGKGLTLNTDYNWKNTLRCNAGLTWMDNTLTHAGVKTRQILTEQFTATWSLGYTFHKHSISIDYTGNVYSPMLLPLAGPYDPRPDRSPWWSIQNIQARYKINERLEVYSGVKNLLNWTPFKNLPFLLARSHDPFDKNVVWGADGQVVRTAENPYGLTFDPAYVYAPNQGIRFFTGIRLLIE